MKKAITLVLVCLIVLSLCPVMAEEAALTAVAPVLPDYSMKFATVSFKGEAEYGFVDAYRYDLAAAPFDAVENDLYVALADLATAYAPDFAINEEIDKITITHVGITAELTIDKTAAKANGIEVELAAAPLVKDGVVFVPAGSLMSTCFLKDVTTQADTADGWYLTISLNTTPLKTLPDVAVMDDMLAGRSDGFLYIAYTIEDDPYGKILPLRMYVPASYDPATPNRAILMLHGNTRNQDFFFADTNARQIGNYRHVEDYAEDYGYILIAPCAYIVAGQYGDVTNIPYMTADTWEPLTEEEANYRILSEKSVLTALDIAENMLNIDAEHLSLMGNSMGGKGVLFFGNKHAELFNAFCPCAMMPNVKLMTENPYPNLVGRPILFTEGTNDQYGFDLAVENFELLLNWLPQMEHHWCEGGNHSESWCISLPEIFAFLNKNNGI